ncbi:hypothetical protein [Ferrimonas balearica]|uniref:hypothetical protein n=1 Tax=Ferrimonas balearica TaxID=44012 RepID=UPI001F34A936|nr:hypothetical protein [Ferrimonas balearica]MBY6093959.1 hypothetical protein [Ferrimonas balearica]
MGFWSGLASAVTSVASSVCRVVTGAVSLVKEVTPLALDAISKVANVVCEVARSLGFLKIEDDPVTLGDKIIQAEEKGITLESCQSDYDLYMEKIRSFRVDPERSKAIDEVDKLKASTITVGARIESHYGTSIAPLIPLIVRSAAFFTAGRLKAILDAGIAVVSIAGYFNSAFDRNTSATVEGQIVSAGKAAQPEMSEDKLREIVRAERA